MPDFLDPRQMQFWTQAERDLWDRLAPVILKIISAGGVTGESLLPKEYRALVSWDVFNQKAIDFLRNYRIGPLARINENTRRRTIGIIEDWIKSGERLDLLEQKLQPVFGPVRANNVAVTEVTRIYAEGNKLAWKATGMVGGNRWNTATDEKVCPVCGPLDGVEVGINDGFTPSGPGEGPTAPPLHPRCRCWLTPVVDIQATRKSFRDILDEE